MRKSSAETRKTRGAVETAAGSRVKVGVGRPADVTHRCKATHDVPWSERCVLPRGHDELPPDKVLDDGTPMLTHRDKKGQAW